MANNPAPNSTLKPETSSDSPSAKSKGVRFVSATQVINHKVIKGNVMSQELPPLKCTSEAPKERLRLNKLNKIKASLISYEIVWATARSPPSCANLLFDAHPARNTG